MLWRWRWNGISLRKRIVPAEDVGTYRGDNRTNYTFLELNYSMLPSSSPAAGVSVPKSPCVSPSRPAVKYRVVAGPTL